MNLPTQRLTITPSEYALLKPGLDVLANGLANAKLGAFPHRHPFDGIDLVASNVYLDRAFDNEMAQRVISLRQKLWDLSQSRKVRLDVFQLAAAALALRLWKPANLSSDIPAGRAEANLLEGKLERYRKRAKRNTINRMGEHAYRTNADRWKRFVAWARFNLLNFSLPKFGNPRRARLWREQRIQLTQVINTVLADGLYRSPEESQMTRIVTLIASSLRRGRYAVGLRELLRAPQSHFDFILRFVEKRVELKRLPGASIPQWRQISDRGDKFRAAMEGRGTKVLNPSSLPEPQAQPVINVVEVERIRLKTGPSVLVTDEDLCDAVANWLHGTVGMPLAEDIVNQARFQVQHNLNQYFKETAADTLPGLIDELRPRENAEYLCDLINQHVELLLGLMLAVGRKATFIYRAVGVALGRARQIEEAASRSRYSFR